MINNRTFIPGKVSIKTIQKQLEDISNLFLKRCAST
jgi:hypothetical protein